jgi:hypothetical protein
LIQDFVDGISVEEFEEYFLEEDSPYVKKIIEPNGDYTIVTTDWKVEDAINNFAMDIGTGYDQEGNPVSRFPEFGSFWYELTKVSPYEDYEWDIIDKVKNEFAKKFHLEW